jgi:signal recognition particle subunit SEC65
MAEEVAPVRSRRVQGRTETDPKRIAEQLAEALREAGYECVIVPERSNTTVDF